MTKLFNIIRAYIQSPIGKQRMKKFTINKIINEYAEINKVPKTQALAVLAMDDFFDHFK